MRKKYIIILLLLIQTSAFGQKNSSKPNKDSLIISGSGKTIREAKYNALEKAYDTIFGYTTSSSSCFSDGKEINQFGVMQSCIIEDYEIIEEKRLTEYEVKVTVKVRASNGSLYFVNNGKFKDGYKQIIFKKLDDAKEYMKYLSECE